MQATTAQILINNMALQKCKTPFIKSVTYRIIVGESVEFGDGDSSYFLLDMLTMYDDDILIESTDSQRYDQQLAYSSQLDEVFTGNIKVSNRNTLIAIEISFLQVIF